MQKLSIEVIENMAKQNITNKEFNFILYVAQYQNDYGVAKGIYYKDICDAMKISFQGFYDCKKSLEDKGIILAVKKNYTDWDITIINNSFAGKENYGRGYVSVHCNMVRSEEYLKCRVGAKLLALLLMRDWKIFYSQTSKRSYPILKTTFIDKYRLLFNVSKRILRSYLGELKNILDIYLENGRKYYITFKKIMLEGDRSESENEEFREHTIRTSCRRNRIKNVSKQEIKEIKTVLCQHHREICKTLTFDLNDILHESLSIINSSIVNPSRWIRKINVPLIHKLIVNVIRFA